MRIRTFDMRGLSALILIAALLCPAASLAETTGDDAATPDPTTSSADAEPSDEATEPGETETGEDGKLPPSKDPLINEPSGDSKKKRSYKQHTAGEKAYDVVLLRPWDFLGLIASSAAFVPTAIMTAPSGKYEVETALDILVIEPYENVFERRLGSF